MLRVSACRDLQRLDVRGERMQRGERRSLDEEDRVAGRTVPRRVGRAIAGDREEEQRWEQVSYRYTENEPMKNMFDVS